MKLIHVCSLAPSFLKTFTISWEFIRVLFYCGLYRRHIVWCHNDVILSVRHHVTVEQIIGFWDKVAGCGMTTRVGWYGGTSINIQKRRRKYVSLLWCLFTQNFTANLLSPPRTLLRRSATTFHFFSCIWYFVRTKKIFINPRKRPRTGFKRNKNFR